MALCCGLRRLHLMDPAAVGKAPSTFKGEGDGSVGKPELRGGKVRINETQCFDSILRGMRTASVAIMS